MLKRYIRILKYGISLDRAYLLIRVIALIITFIASSISLLLPKYLLNAIAAKKLMQILVLLLATLCSGLINALSEKITSPILATRREKMNAKILDDFLKKSIDLELSYFDRPNAYDKYTITFANSMDKVICIRDGKIAETGPPEELLMQPQSIYKQMYDLSTAPCL